MDEFKVGQAVECIDSDMSNEHLCFGHIYRVSSAYSGGGHIGLEGVRGGMGWHTNRFILAPALAQLVIGGDNSDEGA